MPNFCPNCGTAVENNNAFCPKCGAKLSTSVSAVVVHNSDVITDNMVTQNQLEVYPEKCSDPKAVLLKSASPLPKKYGWMLWVYIISLVLAPLTGGAGLLIVLVAFPVHHILIDFYNGKLRNMRFKFVSLVTMDDIYNKIQPVLAQRYGGKMEFDREDDDCISIKYDSIIYDISLKDNNTFSIYWHKSLAGAFFSFNNFKLNKKVRTGMGIIAYELQKQFHVN